MVNQIDKKYLLKQVSTDPVKQALTPVEKTNELIVAYNDLESAVEDVTSSLSASLVVGFYPTGATQAISGAGAINVTSYLTKMTTTGTDAYTLADGVGIGQLKKVLMVVDGGDGTLTPTNLSGGTTITFADAGDFVILMWDGTEWLILETGNSVDGLTAPAVA